MKRRTFVKGAAAALPALAALGLPDFGAAGELAADHASEARKGRRQIRAGGPAGEKDDPQHQSGPASAADTLESPLGGLRGEPAGTGLHGKAGKNGPFGQQLAGNRPVRLPWPEGVYLYEAVPHRLTPVVAGRFSRQGRPRRARRTAPVNIFYVVDLARYVMGEGNRTGPSGTPRSKSPITTRDTGFIAQNVYLFAASQGLAAWFHNCDKENTARGV